MENMKLTFVNVGYGEAILLECPDASRPGGVFTLLIDGGSAETAEYAERSTGRIPLCEYLAQRGLRQIDWMLATHLHEDHLCGLLPAAELLPPKILWQGLPGTFYQEMQPLENPLADTPSEEKFLQALSDYQALCRLVAARGGAVCEMRGGETLEPCEGLRIRVLAPGALRLEQLRELCAALYRPQTPEQRKKRLLRLDAEMNNFSLMLLLEYRGTRILLPGDTNSLGYGEVESADLRADLFKIGHHGQRDGATAELLAAIRPAAVVCCASSDRRYNSADAAVLDLAIQGGAQLYFSDCPRIPGVAEELKPHRALEFTLGENGEITGTYLE